MEDERFDAIIIGGGIAGLSAAMTLARANASFTSGAGRVFRSQECVWRRAMG